MESYKKFRIIVIVTVSTLVTILTPVSPFNDSFVARSLLPEFPLYESESPSPAPAPGPEVMKPITSPANSPTGKDVDSPTASPDLYLDSPAASPEAPADSISPADAPTETDIDSPAASPADSIAASAPTESDIDSPAASPADSIAASAPTESDIDSPAASPEIDIDSPETPADSVSPANPPTTEIYNSPAYSISSTNSPSQESSTVPSGKSLMNSPKNILNHPLLSLEIKTICAKTDNPQLCESSVTPLLTPQLKPDTSSVLILSIQVSINATKAAMVTVDKVAAADCKELYDDAVTNLEDAVNAVESRDIATVNTNLSAAMTDYSTCNDGFEESGEPNPLADVSDKLTKMVSNCLAISTLIK